MVRLYALLVIFWTCIGGVAHAQRVDSTFQVDAKAYTNVGSIVPRADGGCLVLGRQRYTNGKLTGNLVCLLPDGRVNEEFQRNFGLLNLNYAYRTMLLAYPDGRVLVLSSDLVQMEGQATPHQYILRLLANGRLDSSFTFRSSQKNMGLGVALSAAALQPDGRILLGGSSSSYARMLIRLNEDGSEDTSFSAPLSSTYFRDNVHTLAVQPDGRILVGGLFNSPSNSLIRLLPNGQSDVSFRAEVASGTEVQQVLVRPDGRLIVAGPPTMRLQNAVGGIQQLLPDGQVDASFQAPTQYGVLNENEETRLQLLADGRLVVLSSQPEGRQPVVCLLPSGLPDPSLQLAASLSVEPRVVAAEANGHLLVAGTYRHRPGLVGTLQRLSLSGQVDAGYTPQLYASGSVAQQLRLPTGRLVVQGRFDLLGNIPAGNIGCLLPGGEVDTAFARQSPFLDGELWKLAWQPGGKLLVSGVFNVPGRPGYDALVRMWPTGQLDTTFRRISGDRAIYAMTVQPDGRILVGGPLTEHNYDGKYFIRLLPDGQQDLSFNISERLNNQLNESRVVLVQPDGRILLAGRQVHRVFSTGEPDASFQATELNKHVNLLIRDMVQEPNGRLVLCGQMPPRGTLRNATITRLLSNGAPDTTFHENITGLITAFQLYIQPDGKIWTGGYFGYLGQNSVGGAIGVMRLTQQGEYDWTFGLLPGAGNVASFGLDAAGRLLLGGSFVHAPNSPQQQLGLIRLTAPQYVTATLPQRATPALVVYPNPARTVVQVTWPSGPAPRHVRLLDAVGHVVREMTVPANAATSTSLALEQLKPGLYWVRAEYTHGPAAVQRLLVD